MSHSISASPECLAAIGTGAADADGAPGAAAGAARAAPLTPVSKVKIRLPALTLSPILTFTSLTVPAAGEGTSIDALSDSSVISGSSDLTLSPLFTVTSMIGTSLKSPMSGTLTSTRVGIVVPLYKRTSHIGEQAAEMSVEARGCSPIDHAVVPRQRQRLEQARHELLAIPYGFLERPTGPHNGDFGCVDDGREVGATNPTETGDGECAALHLIGLEFAVAGELGKIAHFFRYFDDTLPVGAISGATGVPLPFSICKSYPVKDCDEAEAFAHQILERSVGRPNA